MGMDNWMERVCIVMVWLLISVVHLRSRCIHAMTPDGDALTTFRTKLDDPNNVLQNWDPTLTDPCTWFHVTCNKDDRVMKVDLGNAGLTGKLVPELGELTELQYLGIYDNHINGSIPSELGNLTNLVNLNLSNNSLSGPIPGELGKLSHLEQLRLNNNNLSGRIPVEAFGGKTKYLNVTFFYPGNPYLCNPLKCYCNSSDTPPCRI